MIKEHIKVVIATDSFKGNHSSYSVGELMKTGLLRVFPQADVTVISVADGGDGTAESLCQAMQGRVIEIDTVGPLGNLRSAVNSKYIILNENIAVIELAESAGLAYLSADERNPMNTSTFGLGQQIVGALNNGCREIYIGLGGSATNDLGLGMAQALGYRFFDSDEKNIDIMGDTSRTMAEKIDSITKINSDNVDKRIFEAKIVAMCDVDNVLCGKTGASAIYGPQKGASPQMVEKLDKAIAGAAIIIEKDLGKVISEIPGAGAAGGSGAAVIAFLNGSLKRGIEIILDLIDFDSIISGADVLLTGEGRLDSQTANGKVPVGVAGRCMKKNIPCFAIAGFLGQGWKDVFNCGISGVESSMYDGRGLNESIKTSTEDIPDAAERMFRIIRGAMLIEK